MALAELNTTVDGTALPEHGADADLLNQYWRQLVDAGVYWRGRQQRLTAAAQFLQWWRAREGAAQHCAVMALEPGLSAWETLETYLRLALPERDSRADERARLVPFLVLLCPGSSHKLSFGQPDWHGREFF